MMASAVRSTTALGATFLRHLEALKRGAQWCIRCVTVQADTLALVCRSRRSTQTLTSLQGYVWLAKHRSAPHEADLVGRIHERRTPQGGRTQIMQWHLFFERTSSRGWLSCTYNCGTFFTACSSW